MHRTPLRGVRRPTVENEDTHLGLDGDQAHAVLAAAEDWPQIAEGTLVALRSCAAFGSEALGIRAIDITPRERGRKAEVRIRRKGRDHRTVFHIDVQRLAHRLAERRDTRRAASLRPRPLPSRPHARPDRTPNRHQPSPPPPHPAPHVLRPPPAGRPRRPRGPAPRRPPRPACDPTLRRRAQALRPAGLLPAATGLQRDPRRARQRRVTAPSLTLDALVGRELAASG